MWDSLNAIVTIPKAMSFMKLGKDAACFRRYFEWPPVLGEKGIFYGIGFATWYSHCVPILLALPLPYYPHIKPISISVFRISLWYINIDPRR